MYMLNVDTYVILIYDSTTDKHVQQLTMINTINTSNIIWTFKEN